MKSKYLDEIAASLEKLQNDAGIKKHTEPFRVVASLDQDSAKSAELEAIYSQLLETSKSLESTGHEKSAGLLIEAALAMIEEIQGSNK